MTLGHTTSTAELASLPIGIFDSGMGGLTVWRELRRQLPEESIIYFGDTARVPYGQRSVTEIVAFVQEIIAWMLMQPVKLIAMACNTSSALALDSVRPLCPVPLLGIILPGAQTAVRQGSRIGVLATSATVQSHAYQQAIQENSHLSGKDPLMCWEQACPNFVPLIEAGHQHSPELVTAAGQYLQPLLERQIDTLVYGCTHYPLIAPLIQSLLPPDVSCVDPAVALVEAIGQELDLWGLRRSQGRGETQVCVSGDPHAFARLIQPWLGSTPEVRAVSLHPVLS